MVPMPLPSLSEDTFLGLELGHYRIVERIGSGGMGVVYRAHDEHLDREVAVKVLRPGILADETARKHFGNEALALSKLNHPNVAAIYDFDTHEDTTFLVMEYIPGVPLNEKLLAGALPEKEVLRLGMQIADGLAAAQEHGVVHCDLKPGNLRLTNDGVLKILDFGLAKLRQTVTDSDATGEVLERWSITGTLAYMAPEQVSGEEVDARTDIHAAGLALYEMATGQRAFGEEEISQLVGAILQRRPTPPSTLNPKLSAELVRIIGKCLEKDPENRYQSAKELAIDLRRRQSELSVFGASQAEAVRNASRFSWKTGALAVAIVLGWLAGSLVHRSAPSAPYYRILPIAVDAAAATTPAWSPDGKTLAYSQEAGGYYQIFIRRLDQHSENAAQLTAVPRDCLFPFWHPSGDRVYFLSEHALWSIGAAGGQPEKLIADVFAATISPDGKTILFSRVDKNTEILWTAAADGSDATQAFSLPSECACPDSIHFSPDGQAVSITGYGRSVPGLIRLPFQKERTQVEPVDFHVPADTFIQGLAWLPDNRHVVVGMVSRYSSFTLGLGDTRSGSLEPFPASELLQVHPAVSPDGSRIAYSTMALNWDILEVNLEKRTVAPLVASARYDGWPAWTPSGDYLVFATNRTGRPEIWWKNMREGWERPLVTPDDFDDKSTRLLVAPAVSPDGRFIAYQRWGASSTQIFMSPVSGGKPVALGPDDPARKDNPAWSPDGNWVAFASKGELRRIRPGGRGPAIRMRDDSIAGSGSYVHWSRTGQIVYYSKGGLAVTDDTGTSVHVVDREPLLAWDWSPDGTVVYAIRDVPVRHIELIAIDLKSGKARRLMDLGRKPVSPEPISYPGTIGSLAISPDGKRAVFAYLQPDSHIWMMEKVRKRP
jgi:Tol biopolymer transport system component/tRNA A-37 threonylcarbamoyl transferase component Bud32